MPLPGALARPLAWAGDQLRSSRRVRIALVCAVPALALLGGGWVWLRGSSLVAIERIQVLGLRGPEHAQIEVALRGAAGHMTTLDLDTATLRAAVARYPIVRALRVSTSFPHGLRISVSEQLPVAALQAGGWRAAVAADGVVLGPALLSARLPVIDGSKAIATGRSAGATAVRSMLAVIGAAPAPLARRVAKLSIGSHGITARMRNGLEVYFGAAAAARAKWLALAHVLAAASSAGASYVDVRVPGRPAAGFGDGAGAPEAGSATATASGSEQAGAQQLSDSGSTVEALVEQLRDDSAADGGAPASSPPAGSTEVGTGTAAAGGEASAAEAPAAVQPAPTEQTPAGTETATSEP